MIIIKKMIFIYKNYYIKLLVMKKVNYLILEQIISEGRLEDMVKKYEGKVSEDNIRQLSAGDPSGNNKYLDWMCTQRVDYTSEYIIKMVQCFHENVNRLSEKNVNAIYNDTTATSTKIKKAPKDINSYPVPEDIEVMCKYFEEQKPKTTSRIKIYEDDRWLIVSPLTHEASCRYGSHSNWCVSTSNKDYYDRYTKGGLLVFFLDKKGFNPTKPEANIYKFAVHIDFKEIAPESWDWYSMEDKNIDSILMLNLLPKNLIDVTSKFVKEFLGELVGNAVIPENVISENSFIYHKTADNIYTMVLDFNNKSVEEATKFLEKSFLPSGYNEFVNEIKTKLKSNGFPFIELENKSTSIPDVNTFYIRWTWINYLSDDGSDVKLSDVKNEIFDGSGRAAEFLVKFNDSEVEDFLILIMELYNKSEQSQTKRVSTENLNVGDRVRVDGELLTVKRVAEKSLLLSNGKRKVRNWSNRVEKVFGTTKIINDLYLYR